MSDKRWRMISRIYDEAAALAPVDRVLFLRNACGDDEPLRAEIESLLLDEHLPRFWRSAGLGRDGGCGEAGTAQAHPGTETISLRPQSRLGRNPCEFQGATFRGSLSHFDGPVFREAMSTQAKEVRR